MPTKPVKYKAWFAALVVFTVGLMLTSSDAIVRLPNNNSDGAASSTASAAGADSISAASPVANPSFSADHSARAFPTAAVVDVVLLRALDQAIYYWVGRLRGFVRSYWSGPPGMAEARLN